MIAGIASVFSAAVNGIASAGATGAAGDPGAGSAAASTPFAGVFQSMVEQTSALDQKAAQAVTGLLSGQGVDIHDAMIATEKADMAFELALQVRNKAVGAYQQMMAMQF
jgi:flagellar hook-basal body complex protein FliE